VKYRPTFLHIVPPIVNFLASRHQTFLLFKPSFHLLLLRFVMFDPLPTKAISFFMTNEIDIQSKDK